MKCSEKGYFYCTQILDGILLLVIRQVFELLSVRIKKQTVHYDYLLTGSDQDAADDGKIHESTFVDCCDDA